MGEPREQPVRGHQHKRGPELLAESALISGEIEDLTDEEVMALQTLGPRNDQVYSGLGKIRERHHMIARLLACGDSHTQVAETVGCTVSHINNLMKSDLFLEILEEYRERVTQRLFNVKLSQRVAATADMLVDRVQERLAKDEEAEAISFKDLTVAATGFLDRAGVGPHSTQARVNANLGLTREELEDAKKEKDVTKDSRAEVVRTRGPVALAENAGEGSEGEGAGV